MTATAHPRRILLTGAAGFIGFHTACALHQAGHEVVAIDNMNDAYDPRLKLWRWSELERKYPRITLHRIDITDSGSLRKLITDHNRDHPIHAIINLAARAGVRASVEHPGPYVDTNITGWLNLLQLGCEAGIHKYVLASTSSLYGKDAPMPYHEDQPTDFPLSPYAATKKAAEALAHSFHYLNGLDMTVLRFFTVYGPAGRPDMAPLRFVQRITERRPITVYGDGSQSRDFTYASDIAAGTIAALHVESPAISRYRVINLGSDAPVKVNEFITIIEKLTGQSAIVHSKPGHPADMFATWANIERARKLLGWQPETKLETGLANLVEWYETNRAWASQIVTD